MCCKLVVWRPLSLHVLSDNSYTVSNAEADSCRIVFLNKNLVTITVNFLNVKAYLRIWEFVTSPSPQRELAYHMGSHSFACHPTEETGILAITPVEAGIWFIAHGEGGRWSWPAEPVGANILQKDITRWLECSGMDSNPGCLITSRNATEWATTPSI